ncbi:GIY-YIG nuclease family protein [Pedobacter sp. Leaf41]|uniref:GIY-YIG nuclease family protein n=1 Tax=Pedobacter sp. Leaf41 TaxID=1736218 RepID=UPI001F18BFAD
MTNTFNNVYYIGVTSDLYSRVLEHKEKRYPTSFGQFFHSLQQYGKRRTIWKEAAALI